MELHEFPQCSIRSDVVNEYDRISGIGTRYIVSKGKLLQQSLVFTGDSVKPLLGCDIRCGFGVAQALDLYEATPQDEHGMQQPYRGLINVRGVAWDAGSASMYIATGTQVLHMASDNKISVVAGDANAEGDADGPGADARFTNISDMTSDGNGVLFLKDGVEDNNIRKIQLPATWLEEGRKMANLGAGDEAAAGMAAALHVAEMDAKPTVSTLLRNVGFPICGMAYDKTSSSAGSLVLSSKTAIYRLHLVPVTGQRASRPMLLAGKESEEDDGSGYGTEARFKSITSLVVAGDGCMYVADTAPITTMVMTGFDVLAAYHNSRISKVTPGGSVRTICSPVEYVSCLAILPNGYLAAGSDKGVTVIDLGLEPPRSDALPPGLRRRTLSADLGALLERVLDGSEQGDLKIKVCDQTFWVHSALVCARSSVLQSWRSNRPAKSEYELDVHPDQFVLVLRYLYTGRVDIPVDVAIAVAALAEFLDVPQLFCEAQRQIMASVGPGASWRCCSGWRAGCSGRPGSRCCRRSSGPGSWTTSTRCGARRGPAWSAWRRARA